MLVVSLLNAKAAVQRCGSSKRIVLPYCGVLIGQDDPVIHGSRQPAQPLRWFSSSRAGGATSGQNVLSDYARIQSELKKYPLDAPQCNVSPTLASRVGMQLHRRQNHPLQILSRKIEEYWRQREPTIAIVNDLSPIVSTKQNFDVLRIPTDHISRSPSDTYYLNANTVLRTHTSAHQVDLLRRQNEDRRVVVDPFLVTGDVYRRDEIDRSHYPIFHQTEGVKLFSAANELRGKSDPECIEYIEQDLKQGLEGLAAHLFGADTQMRWVPAYFPFTDPSLELEIFFQDDWLEVLGCGVIHPDIIKNSGLNPATEKGWAFGLGLERLAMVLFDIPDIRLFWTEDARFHNQFQSGQIVQFQPYSKYPSCYKDISFWLPQPTEDPSSTSFHVNDLNEMLRDVGGDLVEQVQLIDDFVHPKTGRQSHCYRIQYRSMDRSLTNEEIDDLQERVREEAVKRLKVELR